MGLCLQRNLIKHKLPVTIAFTFIRGTRHKFDYINPAQTIQDDMVKHGWIEDDDMHHIIPVFPEYRYDKTNPGVFIEILKRKCSKQGTKNKQNLIKAKAY